MLEITENPKIQSDFEYEQKQVASKPGQISEYRDSSEEWRELVQVVETTEVYVREQGLSRDCHKELEKLPGLEVETEKAINVKEQLIEFVQKESLKAEPEERLLGSGEVIESLWLSGNSRGFSISSTVISSCINKFRIFYNFMNNRRQIWYRQSH